MNEELISKCRLTDEEYDEWLSQQDGARLYFLTEAECQREAQLAKAIPVISAEAEQACKDLRALEWANWDMQKTKEVAEARKRLIASIEKYVFYVDSRGYIALKPNATKNWLALKEGSKEAE